MTLSTPHRLWPLVLPWFMVLIMILASPFLQSDESGKASVPKPAAPEGQVVLVIVDSLREQALTDHMPHTKALAKSAQGDERAVRTCSANFTLPCIQTLMEGRQSPFSAGLHNFTGKQGGAGNLPELATQAKLKTVLISDFTLDDLYGRKVHRSVNVEGQKLSVEERDFWAIEEAKKEIQQGTPFVVLHLVGTDKIAHRKRPGHPKYAEHFSAVDTKLQPLYAMLSPKDHLVVTGDHGHDKDGHHTRDSVAVFRSPLIHEILRHPSKSLEQTEMTYLLASTLQLAVPPHYEGRYLGLEGASRAPKTRSASLESVASLNAESLGMSDTSSFDVTLEKLRTKRREAPLGELLGRTPLFVLFLAWLVLACQQLRGASVALPKITLAGCGVAVVLWGAGFYLPPWVMVVVALGGLGGLGWHLRRVGDAKLTRFVLWMIGLVAMASFTGLVAPGWSKFFHSHGQFQLQTPGLFVGMVLLGLAGSWFLERHLTKRAPQTVGGLFLFGLPSGVYFYQFGQNITRGMLIGCALWGVGMLVRHRSEIKAALSGPKAYVGLVMTVLSSGFLLWQKSGGWEWHFRLTRAVYAWPQALFWVVLLGVCGWLLWSVPRHKVLLGVMLGLGAGYSYGFAELSDGTLLSAMVPVVWLSGVLSLYQQSGRDTEAYEGRTGFLMFALLLMSMWIMMRGFFIQNVGFDFALKYLSGLQRERDVAIVASLMTYFKYAFPLWALVLVWAGHQKDWSAARWMLWWFGFKILTLMIQIHCGPVLYDEKLYELAMAEVTSVFNVGLMAWVGLGVVWLARRRQA